jgi:hypothetical protein
VPVEKSERARPRSQPSPPALTLLPNILLAPANLQLR